ncbi:winged helix-turn-helix transcriptional regulator [Castellaniella sp.]|uniref:winged helix-turn-helix transcriptional regulator n=1 Tax=Castellaniella sp. TaxID=1955812 RepID=UPI003C7796D1
MTTQRSYGDGCAAAHALDLIGERWALLIVRELLLGPKRFTDLRAGLPGISANVLTQRLTRLEASGVLSRRRLPPPASVAVYDLSPWGRELEPILLQLVRWGVQSPAFVRGSPLNADALILSFRTLFDPLAAQGRDTCVTLVLDGQAFSAMVLAGQLDVARGPAAAPSRATLSTDPTTLLHMAYGHIALEAMLAQGRADYSGERAAIERFLGCFSVPGVAAPD